MLFYTDPSYIRTLDIITLSSPNTDYWPQVDDKTLETYGVPFVSKLHEIEVFTNVRGYLQMSVDIYKFQWVFTNVIRDLQMSVDI